MTPLTQELPFDLGTRAAEVEAAWAGWSGWALSCPPPGREVETTEVHALLLAEMSNAWLKRDARSGGR